MITYKLLLLTSVIAFFLSAPPVEAALQTNTNFAIKPDSMKCVNIEIPDDFGLINTRKEFSITTDCGGWCSLSRAVVITTPLNQITVPLCITAFEKKVGESGQFTVSIDSGEETRKFRYGVCVSANEDVNTGEGEPCKAVTETQKFFDISFSVREVSGTAGDVVEYIIYIFSEAEMEIDLKSSTGENWRSVKTVPGERMSVTGTAVVGEGAEISVQAVARDCNLEGCSKSVSIPVISREETASPASNFSVLLTPEKINTQSIKAQKYSLDIINYGEPRTYTIDLILPPSINSDYISTSRKVSDRDTINFEAMPQAKGLHEITAKVTNEAGQQKLATAYLSVDEISSDLGRAIEAGGETGTVRENTELQRGIGDISYEEAIRELEELKGKQRERADAKPRKTEPSVQQGNSNLIIYLTISTAIIAAVLLTLFLKSRKTKDEDEFFGEEEYSD